MSKSDSIRQIRSERSPPSPFLESLFDFVFGISVFTHLNEGEQLAWLGELRRVTRPDAILLLTVFNQHDHRSPSLEEQERLAKEGFLYKIPKSEPDATGYSSYHVALHTRDYMYRTWSKFFKIREYIERGLNQHQDLVILQGNKASDAVDLRFEKTSSAFGTSRRGESTPKRTRSHPVSFMTSSISSSTSSMRKVLEPSDLASFMGMGLADHWVDNAFGLNDEVAASR